MGLEPAQFLQSFEIAKLLLYQRNSNDTYIPFTSTSEKKSISHGRDQLDLFRSVCVVLDLRLLDHSPKVQSGYVPVLSHQWVGGGAISHRTRSAVFIYEYVEPGQRVEGHGTFMIWVYHSVHAQADTHCFDVAHSSFPLAHTPYS